MKKLIITLLLLLNITLISAQATMQGMWTCEGSSYITTILKIEDKVTEVLNYSFEAGKSVPENIVNQTNKKLKLGICGVHGVDPRSIEFCSKSELDSVSCSLFMVPVAILSST